MEKELSCKDCQGSGRDFDPSDYSSTACETCNGTGKASGLDVLKPQGEARFSPPDNGDIGWQAGNQTFTREEVALLLWTQRSMIHNDMKRVCGKDLTPDMIAILNSPRSPEY